MNKKNWLLFFVAFALIGGTAVALSWVRAHQKLGTPGIKAKAIPGTIVMDIDLPEKVIDFTSTNVPQAEVVLNYLPKDTSFAQRLYSAPDGFAVNANIVLMGMDRTSIHNPEICLPGQGWRIDSRTNLNITIDGGPSLSVAKWTASNFRQTSDGQRQEVRGIYVFWFVADNEQTSVHSQRLWWMARDMLRTGVLQRWAYVSYFAMCLPGQEEATFDRVQKLIAASVPEFQLPPASSRSDTVAKQ
jgi:hypothetical protein